MCVNQAHCLLHAKITFRFVIANDVFKLKEFNLESKQCRRTSLAPRFGNPPTTLLIIPPPPSAEVRLLDDSSPTYPDQGRGDFERNDNESDGHGEAGGEAEGEENEGNVVVSAPPPSLVALPEYFAFATNNRVIGVSSFPLTGDPSQVCADFYCAFLSNDRSLMFLSHYIADDGNCCTPQ